MESVILPGEREREREREICAKGLRGDAYEGSQQGACRAKDRRGAETADALFGSKTSATALAQSDLVV